MKVYQITNEVNPEDVKSQLGENIDFEYIHCPTEEDTINNCKDAEVLISLYEPIGKKTMDALENLKYICVASIGFDLVDLDYAKEKGIVVSNNPHYCIEEVADHTMALILNLNRNINKFNHDVKINKEWNYDAFGNTMHRMSSRTAGVIGFGSIARELVKRLQGFGVKVIVSDPFVDEDAINDFGAEKVELDELFERSDFISIHVPLNEHTKYMINEKSINKMKKKPYIINCSRGELVDLDALYNGVKEGKLKGAGLDVLHSENPDLENLNLVELDDVLLTPHVAFYSIEAIEDCDLNVGRYVENYNNGNLDEIPWVLKG